MVESIQKTIKVSKINHKKLNLIRVSEDMKTMGDVIEKLIDFYNDNKGTAKRDQSVPDNYHRFRDQYQRYDNELNDDYPTIEIIRNYSSLMDVFSKHQNVLILFESTKEEYNSSMKQAYQSVSDRKRENEPFVKCCLVLKSETTDGILGSYNVNFLPSLIFFVDKQEIARYTGIFNSDDLNDILKINLKLNKMNVSQ